MATPPEPHGIESLLDPSGRARWQAIKAGDAARFPYSAICAVGLRQHGRHFHRGTGCLVGERLLLTAGHVLAMSLADDDHFVVEAGRAGSARPFGTVRVMDGQFLSRDMRPGSAGDLAVALLDQDLGSAARAGHLRISALSDADISPAALVLIGYPEGAAAAATGDTPCWDRGAVLRVEEARVHYDIDTLPGCSGAPLLHFAEGADQPDVVAVHTTDSGLHDDLVANLGLRLNGVREDWLRSHLEP